MAQAASMREVRNMYRILVGNLKGRKLVRRVILKWILMK
jgi:hypothetical protein